jgi:hypothetical protein
MTEPQQPDDAVTGKAADALSPDVALSYKATVDLLIASGAQNWARFNAMLVANSILLAIVGQIVIQRKQPALLPWYWAGLLPALLPVAGLVLCVAWFAAVSRGAQYQEFYMGVAHEIEEASLSPRLRVLLRGRRYADNCMQGVGKLSARHAMEVVIWVFVALHLGLLVLVVLSARAPR